MRLSLLLLILTCFGCSSIQKMAMRSASPVFVQSGDLLTHERSWDFFRESAPANLKFLELLYLQDPENLELLSVVIKSFAGYAYGVPETLAYGDELAGVEGSIHKTSAILYYTRALDYGVSYLQQKGIKHHLLLDGDEKELKKTLDEKLGKKDLTAVLFFAQAWASLINLQKENIALVSYVPKVKQLFDWVCKREPEIENGVCEIFAAQYEASRPRMLGGNPEKGKELYAKAIQARPHHLLIQVGYLQYLAIPAFDKEAYEKIASQLRVEFAKWDDLNRDTLVDKSDYKSDESLHLFNAIARKRFELMEQNKQKIFEG